MEPSKILGSKEECSGSVSGWTTYIGSPAHEYHNYDDDDDSNTYQKEDTGNNDDCSGGHGDDDKSDDSMASDASSGPSHQELSWGSNKQSLDKHATDKYSKQKHHKQKTNRDESRIKVERDGQPLKAKSAASQAPSGAKVKKSK